MKHLSIDIETYSSVDIGKSGAYKYAESEDFEILLFAYKEDSYDTKVVDLACGEAIPPDIVSALSDPGVIKHAYNAVFEWTCLNAAGYATPIEQWRCTMVHGLYLGYPAGLSEIGKAIGLSGDKQKMSVGNALIKYFCSPCKPTRTNGKRTRNLPAHDENKWRLFKDYNVRDVDTEYAVLQVLKAYPVPDDEINAWFNDVRLNSRGVRVDEELITGALALSDRSTEELINRAKGLTRLDNPNSNAQMLDWLIRQGLEIDNLRKETVAKLLERDLPENVREALELRQKISKSSIKKYEAMTAARCSDGKVRGLLQFYGANRTGRWAGRLVQVQNLPRTYIKTLDIARRLVKSVRYKELKMLYDNVPDTLSQLIRTAFIASEGYTLVVSDFSAIEARVIAWLAGEQWVLDVFKQGGDIYCAAASQMFGVPVEKHGANAELRQKGKVATLALGYQGGANALVQMGALNMGLTEEELPDIVNKWRLANPNITALWNRLNHLALHTVETGDPTYLSNITLRLEKDVVHDKTYFTIELPSGRKLFYSSPGIGVNKWGHPSIEYMGVDQTKKKWSRLETYGGKLAENITQAVARDCLSVAINRCIEAGFAPVMHVHDEIIIDGKKGSLDTVNEIFSMPIAWAPGLPLAGAGFESDYYLKD